MLSDFQEDVDANFEPLDFPYKPSFSFSQQSINTILFPIVHVGTGPHQVSEASSDDPEGINKHWTIAESRMIDIRQEYLNVSDSYVDSSLSTDARGCDNSSLSHGAGTDTDTT